MIKALKKIKLFLILFCFFVMPAFSNPIDDLINATSIDSDATYALYVYDLTHNKELYKKNENKLLNPASILKVLTFGSSYKVLKKDYRFETGIYKYNNDIYLKLGADTLFSRSDLGALIASAKKQFDFSKVNNIYIDDTIFDKTPYPMGWTKDDLWPYQAPISPYIIDSNKVQILIKRSSLSTKVDIMQSDDYKMPIVNKLTLFYEGADNDIKISRLYGENSPIIEFSGHINKDLAFDLPVNNPELNFKIKFHKELDKKSIVYDKFINNKKVPLGAKKLTSISHSIEDVSKPILINSNNINAEVVFRAAASKYFNKCANFDDAKKMFFEVFDFVNPEEIKLEDASGVTRYNLISAKVATKIFQNLANDEDFMKLLAKPNEGTLANRFLFLENNLRAKTGTLAGVSSLLAEFQSYNKNKIVACSIIQNSQKKKSLLKDFENRLIAVLYRKY